MHTPRLTALISIFFLSMDSWTVSRHSLSHCWRNAIPLPNKDILSSLTNRDWLVWLCFLISPDELREHLERWDWANLTMALLLLWENYSKFLFFFALCEAQKHLNSYFINFSSVTTHTETYNDTGIWAACFRSLVVRTGHCCKKQTGYGKCYAALTHKQILIHHMVTVNRVDWTRSMCMHGASLDFACVHSRKFIFSYVEKQFQEVPLNVVKNRINFIVF